MRTLGIFAVLRTNGRMNRLRSASVGHYAMGSVKLGQAKYKGSIQYMYMIRQRRGIRRKTGETVCFEDNACVIVNNKAEMKGTHITGPICKEAAALKSVAGKCSGIF